VTEEHERLIANLAAYALGSLESAERTELEAHLTTCSACAERLTEYRAVAGSLPLGLDLAAPPPEAWLAIRTAVRARQPRTPEPSTTAARPAWRRVLKWPALAAVVGSLLIWNVMLRGELTRRAPGPAPGPEVEALSRRPWRVLILRGTGAPEANARIFVAVDGGGHLAISGLDPLPRERTYQLWFIRRDAPPVSGATFGVDKRGIAWAKVTVPATLDDVRTIVVTEEAAPGSVGPTGVPLLSTLDWR
jgi:anti-sigma factor RsiW